jgi:hypothetical protein
MGGTMRDLSVIATPWSRALILGPATLLFLVTAGAAEPTARIAESGDAVELDYSEAGGSYKDTIPLHRAGLLRYFSAGVGIEERSATYPTFPLKLVFTAGGKPYVAGVSVEVQRTDGTTLVTIPREHITGPWLFLDVPDGSYHIAATLEGQTEHLRDVKAEQGIQRILHVRWAADPGGS